MKIQVLQEQKVWLCKMRDAVELGSWYLVGCRMLLRGEDHKVNNSVSRRDDNRGLCVYLRFSFELGS